MKRFQWTRARYHRAHHLARLLPRFYILPEEAPALVQRYWNLWEQHPQRSDELAQPMMSREPYCWRDDGLPF